jgi:hypothetical protein
MAEHFVANFGTDRKGSVKCLLLYLRRGTCRSPQRSAHGDSGAAARSYVSVAGWRDVDRLPWKLGGLVLEEQYCG